MTVQGKRRSLRTVAVVAPLLMCLLMGAWLLCQFGEVAHGPNGAGFENAFATYTSGAAVLRSGGNPYDPRAVCRTERARLVAQHVRFDQPQWNCRLGNPPLFLWALEPLARLPFQLTALVWLFGMLLLSFAGFVLLLRWFGWQGWLLPAAVGLLMPPTLYANFYGEVNGLIFAGVAAALYLLRRHPMTAGAIGALGWIKPPLALPFLILMVIFLASQRRRVMTGFAGATGAGIALTIATTGMRSLLQWGQSLLAFSHDTGDRGHVVSLLGLYVRVLPPAPRLVLEAVALLFACGATYAVIRHTSWRARPLEYSVWLWTLWFLVTPYGQYYDLIVLALPVLVFLRPPGSGCVRMRWMPALYLLALSLILVAARVYRIELLTFLPLALCIAQIRDLFEIYRRDREVARRPGAHTMKLNSFPVPDLTRST